MRSGVAFTQFHSAALAEEAVKQLPNIAAAIVAALKGILKAFDIVVSSPEITVASSLFFGATN